MKVLLVKIPELDTIKLDTPQFDNIESYEPLKFDGYEYCPVYISKAGNICIAYGSKI